MSSRSGKHKSKTFRPPNDWSEWVWDESHYQYYRARQGPNGEYVRPLDDSVTEFQNCGGHFLSNELKLISNSSQESTSTNTLPEALKHLRIQYLEVKQVEAQ